MEQGLGKTLRLVLPQWQGGDQPTYHLGARVLAAILPEATGPVEKVAVPPAKEEEREEEDGILSRSALLDNLDKAFAAIDKHKPDSIVTVGGDCLVDLAPIAYLNEKYGEDLAVLWIDAHPDIMSPNEYNHAHAHVLAMLMGEGDKDFVDQVPLKLKPEQVLYVGLNEPSSFESGFIQEKGLAALSPEDLADSPDPVIDWLKERNAKYIAVHFDLDVLSASLYDFLYFRNPNVPESAFDGIAQGKMQLPQISKILKAANAQAPIVGLAITEFLPWNLVELSNTLSSLPLIGENVSKGSTN